ncbi:MAG: hypothetical protein QOG50_2981 [Actinomycetota bacterium]|jgi:hypothetical protein|nr:hypothetical protein [Actinomycetota bacterium]
MAGEWAGGAGGAHDTYIGNRLQYRAQHFEGDKAFQSVSARTALLASATLFLGSLLCLIPAALLGALFRSPPLIGILWLVLVVLLCFLPWREWVSQWELTLDGKGDAAENAYASIIGALKRDRIPVGIDLRRIGGGAGTPVRNYLVVSSRPYRVFVGVFAYGDGLFVSWSMWRSRRIIAIPWVFLLEMFSWLRGRGSQLHEIVRTDPARAMREAVHNAVREGIDAAASGLSVDASFLTTIPITHESDMGSARSAPPRPAAPPPRPAARPPVPAAPLPPVSTQDTQPRPVAPSAPVAAAAPPPDPTQRLQ